MSGCFRDAQGIANDRKNKKIVVPKGKRRWSNDGLTALAQILWKIPGRK